MAALSVYLDSSVVVPLFLMDPFVARARSLLASQPGPVVVSDFVAAEFASVVGIRMRMKILTKAEARQAFSNFDAWTSSMCVSCQISPEDVRIANNLLRRLDLTLRAPDAINLAIVQRLNINLATFDVKLGACAGKLGIAIACT